MSRRTKIVATLGPATDPPEVLDVVIAAGVDVVRLNLSHGSLEGHLQRLQHVREAAERAGRHVAVLADLPGPKVRCGGFGDRGVHLATGSFVALEPGDGPCDESLVFVDYPALLDDLTPGDTVIIGDGAITMSIEDVNRERALAQVVTGGRATGRPGFHIPSERLRLTTPTEEDLRLLDRVQEAGVDFVAVSFVRSAADLHRVRSLVRPGGPYIVAKVETVLAVQHLDEILAATDAVMVARGDLGIELPMEEVPHVQKQVIRSCVAASVPVITATQMLESMINSPAPTRAEVSDVANAVFDGTDAVMLSGETAIGHDPALVVRTMARIAERAEQDAAFALWAGAMIEHQRAGLAAHARPITRAVTAAAWQAATDVGAAAVLVVTRTGRSAVSMARYRPQATLVGLSDRVETLRGLSLVWGVTPRPIAPSTSTDEMVWHAVESASVAGDVRPGDIVAVVARSPDSPDNATDVLRLVRVD
jgi:pyruvate kinase